MLPRFAICVDFEATCFDGKRLFTDSGIPVTVIPCGPEIIEIGAVLYDLHTHRVVRRYQSRIRPTQNQILSGFCKRLLRVHQTEIDQAPTFEEAWPGFVAAVGPDEKQTDDYMVFTCGSFDLSVYLPNQWRISFGEAKLPPPQLPKIWKQFVDIQMMFWAWTGQHHVGLRKILKAVGQGMQGLRRHTALGDAIGVQRFLTAASLCLQPEQFEHLYDSGVVGGAEGSSGFEESPSFLGVSDSPRNELRSFLTEDEKNYEKSNE